MAAHGASLPGTLRGELYAARARAQPASGSARDTVVAERAVAELEQRLDEALGLAADLQRTVEPVLPSRAVVARWAAMTAMSCLLLFAGVMQLGLGDFMLQAFGVKVLRANATMPCDRFSFEAERAAAGGVAPEHAQWVDPP